MQSGGIGKNITSGYFKMMEEYNKKYADKFDGKTSGQKCCYYGTNTMVNIVNNQG